MALFLAQTKKAQERKLICKRKTMPEGDFRHMYAADASLHSCLFCCLLATFFLSFPAYEKYERNRGLPRFGRRLVRAGAIKTGKKTFECHEWPLNI